MASEYHVYLVLKITSWNWVEIDNWNEMHENNYFEIMLLTINPGL